MTDKFYDEETRTIYKARLDYAKNKNNVEYWNSIKKFQKNKKWICYDKSLELIKKSYADSREIILFGCGNDGFASKETLEMFGVEVSFFCDNNRELQGGSKYGVKVISPKELSENHGDAIVLVTTSNHGDVIEKQLLDLNIPKNNVIRLKYGKLIAGCPEQYFDVFESDENEVFIDAGAFDGLTTLQFIKWAKSYRAAYVMEPYRSAHKYIEKNLKKKKNIYVVNKAAWKDSSTILFGGNERGASIGGGDEVIQAIKIDDMVGDNEITFIKMDIEGSEYEALIGSERTIQKNKPKLAICVYHKLEDTEKFVHFLEQLVPEYKFALRHYSTCMWETVLYAWV